MRYPQATGVGPAEKARTDLADVAPEIGDEVVWCGPALTSFRLRVLGKEVKLGPVVMELEVMIQCQRGEATAANRPKAEDGEDKAITELDLALLAEVDWPAECLVHQLESEIQGETRGSEGASQG